MRRFKILLPLAIFGILLLAYTITISVKHIRHLALLEAFGGSGARAVEAKLEIAERIPRLLTADFYTKDTATRTRIASDFWRKKILPLAADLDPDYVRELRRKFFQAVHA